MKTKVIYLLWLLALLLSATGCDKDEIKEDDTYFEIIENEVITEELVNVPAYVWYQNRDITVICYSRYAHEYGEQFLKNDSYYDYDRDEYYETIVDIRVDLITHLIGIPTADYEKYRIGLNQNVFITASITNNNTHPFEEDDSYTDFVYNDIYKAYLKDVKLK